MVEQTHGHTERKKEKRKEKASEGACEREIEIDNDTNTKIVPSIFVMWLDIVDAFRVVH